MAREVWELRYRCEYGQGRQSLNQESVQYRLHRKWKGGKCLTSVRLLAGVVYVDIHIEIAPV